MRISEIDLQCEDIMWFSTDDIGNVFECTSAGCGNVPEYVCKSREEMESLLDYFTTQAPVITTEVLLLPDDKCELAAVARNLASKGIYCFDITDYDDEEHYHCIAIPQKALHITDLPAHIRELLTDHKYPGNVSQERMISVIHAY